MVISIYGRSREYGARPIDPGAEVHLTKLTDTHKFRISVGKVSLDYSVDTQSLNLFFKNKNNQKLFTVFK